MRDRVIKAWLLSEYPRHLKPYRIWVIRIGIFCAFHQGFSLRVTIRVMQPVFRAEDYREMVEEPVTEQVLDGVSFRMRPPGRSTTG